MIQKDFSIKNQSEVIGNSVPCWVVKNVKPKEDYLLELLFADGREGIYDAKPLLKKKIYQPLNDIAFFMKARVFGDSVIWNNDIDIAPEHLYTHSIFKQLSKSCSEN